MHAYILIFKMASDKMRNCLTVVVGDGMHLNMAPNCTAYTRWSCHIGLEGCCANCVDTSRHQERQS